MLSTCVARNAADERLMRYHAACAAKCNDSDLEAELAAPAAGLAAFGGDDALACVVGYGRLKRARRSAGAVYVLRKGAACLRDA